MTSDSLLARIQGPRDLDGLSPAERTQLAAEIREEICQVVSKNGGHFGANMGVVELSIALHTVFDSPNDKIVWDTSHQCYPHKLLTGRQPEFHTLRTYGGMSGFCHKGESEHDTAYAGHAGTAASIAVGIAQGNQMRSPQRYAIGVVGDSAMVSGMTLEALNSAGCAQLDARVLIVLNDNGMSIDYPVGGIHRTLQESRPWVSTPHAEELGKSKEEIAAERATRREASDARIQGFFESMGVRYHGPVDGQDTEALIEALHAVKDLPGPTLLHIHTFKGAGWDPAYQDPVAWHAAQGFLGPQPAVKPAKPRSWTEAFADTLIELADEDERVVAITAGMPGGTGLSTFRKRHPERTFDVGICEQHGAGFASGLRVAGQRPVLTIYSTFLQRCYDQILHDVALQENPMLIAMDRGGLVGADGVTHQGLFDISYLRCIPNVVLAAPSHEAELRAMMRWALESERVVGLRWPRGAVPPAATDELAPINLGQGEIVAVGDGSIAFFAYGAMVEHALAARELLQREDGIKATVVNARFAKPVDLHLLEAILESHDAVLTVEDHVVMGGFGSGCLEAVNELAPEHVARLKIAGVPDHFVHHGARELQLRDARLDAAGLAERARASLSSVAQVRIPELSLLRA